MTKTKRLWRALRLAALALVGAAALGAMTPEPAFAQETSAAVETVAADEGTGEVIAVQEAAPEAPALTVDKGDTGWMLVSTVLVLLMIIPGLALFYGGLVRAKNMVSILSQVFVVTGIGMVMWLLVGYSLAFTDDGGLNHFVGG